MAVSKEKKEATLENYAEWLKKSQAIILVEYTGAKMKDLDAMRAKIRESGGEFHVVKNTLARRSRIVAMSFCEPRSCRLQLSS